MADLIAKKPTPANLADYAGARASFRWKAARAELDGLPNGAGLHIAHEAIDRHAAGRRGAQVAIRWCGKSGERRELTYADLRDGTARFAFALTELGIRKGDRVFSLLGRVPELFLAAFGALKTGAVFSPLFSAFGPDPIRARLALGDARVLVTTADLYRRKVAPIVASLSSLEHIILVGPEAPAEPGSKTMTSFSRLLEQGRPSFAIPPTRPEDMALLHFTSGTTGTPKGAIHVHEAVVAHAASAKLALDLRPDDVFWCTADPGWVTGTSYGMIAPLVIGCTLLVDEAEFDAERWYRTLREESVTVWYTAPTAIRMLMRIGTEGMGDLSLPKLRFMASVGEPLNAEAVVWSQRVLGRPFHDNWWQTETGGIMIANYAAMDVKPGSMGKPLPGVDAAIVHRREDGGVDLEERPGVDGELALRRGWPSMFRGYLHQEERYAKCFAGDWYLTGDLVRRDEDGYWWFVGRADDVIKSAGHLIGPFEVESALMEHPAVAEAAVIGKPDPLGMEVVKAFVALKRSHPSTPALGDEILAFARKRLGPAIAPREIAIVPDLPRTKSGKIMRRLLRARELGLPEGDTSTLEGRE